jgi:hypothetical protein
LIAFAAELTRRVGLNALLTFAVGFGPLLVLAASFVDPRAYWRITRFDLLCGAFSIVALIGWAVTGTGEVAICFSILADLLGAIPTVRKAYAFPASESANAFACSAAGAAITLLTIKTWTFASAAFPSYILVIALALAVLVMTPRRRRRTAGAR